MRSNFVDTLIGWLRAGYPQGVPRQDYVALFGLLRRQLTLEEVAAFAQRLRADGTDVCDEQIRAIIEESVLQRASEDDIRRVASHLAAGGWPLAEMAPANTPDTPR